MQLTNNEILATTGALVREIRWFVDHRELTLEQGDQDLEAVVWWLGASVDAYVKMMSEVMSFDVDQGIKDYLQLSPQTWEAIDAYQQGGTT